MNTQMDPFQNQNRPYYLHLRENPTMVLVSTPLNGSNYHSWACVMRRAISGKNKIHFIDGSIPMPDSFDPYFDLWECNNNLVHSWLMDSVSSSIAQSIVYMDSAADVWRDLKERFSQGDLVHIAELQQKLYSFRQDSSSVTDYFTELKVLWEELKNYRPTRSCVCDVKCTAKHPEI